MLIDIIYGGKLFKFHLHLGYIIKNTDSNILSMFNSRIRTDIKSNNSQVHNAATLYTAEL